MLIWLEYKSKGLAFALFLFLKRGKIIYSQDSLELIDLRGHLFFNIFEKTNQTMKKGIFTLLSKFNKKILPSYSKQQLDLQKATKLQKAVIGWKLWVTKNTLN